jgi:hypothetical protein
MRLPPSCVGVLSLPSPTFAADEVRIRIAILLASSLASNLAADRAAWAVAVARLSVTSPETHLNRHRRLPAARSTKHEFIFRSLGPGGGAKTDRSLAANGGSQIL